MSNTVSFYVNGHRVVGQGAGANAGFNEARTGDFKTHSTSYTLLPVVCMYSVRPSKLCRVTFNFMGPFVRKQMTGWDIVFLTSLSKREHLPLQKKRIMP
jgi:hypothetical protein